MQGILRDNQCTITPECHIKGKRERLDADWICLKWSCLDLLHAVNWLLCYVLDKSVRKVDRLGTRAELSAFDVKNAAQVYHLRTLSILYIQVFIHPRSFLSYSLCFQRTAIARFYQFIETNDEIDRSCKQVLDQLLTVHTLKFLEENLNLLFEGNYLRNGLVNLWIQNRLIDLCEQLRNDAVTLVDVFAPPDHILNSVLGVKDGKVMASIRSSSEHFFV